MSDIIQGGGSEVKYDVAFNMPNFVITLTTPFGTNVTTVGAKQIGDAVLALLPQNLITEEIKAAFDAALTPQSA